MTPLRSLLAGAAALVLTPTLASAATCLQPAEQTHFHVRALQSQLMVVAISCELQDDYNRFVTKFQPHLATAFRGIQGHFRRAAGSAGQRQTDQYITNLANGQSQAGIAQGTLFCRNQAPLFQEAIAAPNVQALAQLSVAREIPHFYDAPACGTASPQRAQGQQRAQSQRPRSQQPQRAQGQRSQGQQRAQGQSQTATR
ncbi:hypothetical protein [Sabulicella glaciei]|uniref:Uncharacterized protein n=1 Tax=Sabulicella glaciei TaxID=2984948 RepID=A0ABT3NU17_9PROT|nr:hypothetical protein [Roseococcus sp. MDT2-1-1]MCW8085657.1 hypothetical protein [Roseococcus sp. MDT2-1-1]